MGFPKAAVALPGTNPSSTRLAGLLATRCESVIVVLGAEAERIRASMTRPVTFAINHDYSRGMTTSLQCGLRAVPAHAEGILFTLVDHPAVGPATLDALLDAPRPLLARPPISGQTRAPDLVSP